MIMLRAPPYLLTPSWHQEPMKRDATSQNRQTQRKSKSKTKKTVADSRARNFTLLFFFSLHTVCKKTAPHHRRKHNHEKMQTERIPKPKKRKARARKSKDRKDKRPTPYAEAKEGKKYLSEITKHPEEAKASKKNNEIPRAAELLPQSISIETVITPL